MIARQVLNDCDVAYAEVIAATQDTLRRRWFTMLTLLRAVGHVLDKVDGKSGPKLRTVINAKWATKKTAPIFKDFIDSERNNILKVYQFSVGGDLTIVIPPPGGHVVDPDGNRFLKPTFQVLLKSGPFAGQDPYTVLRQAIQFWRDFLDEVDGDAK